MRRYRTAFCLATVTTLLLPAGCASTSTSNTARTAKEQMLISDAVERSLSKVDFRPVAGQNVFVEEKYLDCVDKPFVVGSVRHQVMRFGGRLVDAADGADVVIELRSGGVGTDTSESFLGTPEIALPGMLTIPEIHLAERKSQKAYARIGMVMYDARSRAVLGEGGVAAAESDDHNWFVFGIGPVQSGSLEESIRAAQRPAPGMKFRKMPTVVAFQSRPSLETPASSDVRFASRSETEEPSDPSAETSGTRP